MYVQLEVRTINWYRTKWKLQRRLGSCLLRVRRIIHALRPFRVKIIVCRSLNLAVGRLLKKKKKKKKENERITPVWPIPTLGVVLGKEIPEDRS